MDIPANKQLVPYYPEQYQVIPAALKTLPAVPDITDRSSKQCDLMLLPIISGNEKRPGLRESAYDSNRRLKALKTNQKNLEYHMVFLNKFMIEEWLRGKVVTDQVLHHNNGHLLE